MFAHINLWAVVAAAIGGMIVGWIWYSPMLFGNTWIRIMGMDPKDSAKMEQMKRGMGPMYGVAFLGALVSAFILAKFLVLLGAVSVSEGLKIAFGAWLGFILPVNLGNALFSGKDKSLIWTMFFVQAGHHLAGMLVMGAILTAWR